MINVFTNASIDADLETLLKNCDHPYEVKSYEDDLNQSYINLFPFTDDLAGFLDQKLSSKSRTNNSYLILNGSNYPDNFVLDYPFSHVYTDVPSQEQFKLDIAISLADKRKLIQHYKTFFVGMMLESALHEMNNPITSISLNCQFILEMLETGESMDNEQLNKMVGSINSTVNSAATVSKNLVNFARQPDYEGEFINGKDILNATYIYMKPIVRMKRHDLTIEDSDSLIFANKSDFTLLFIILVYLIIQFLSEKDHIVIKFSENLMVFEFEKSLEEISDLYLNQKLPVFDLKQVIEEISAVNNFELSAVNGNLHIKTSAEMPEE